MEYTTHNGHRRMDFHRVGPRHHLDPLRVEDLGDLLQILQRTNSRDSLRWIDTKEIAEELHTVSGTRIHPELTSVAGGHDWKVGVEVWVHPLWAKGQSVLVGSIDVVH